MSIANRVAAVLGQVLGLAALLLGAFLLWGLGWSLLIAGILLLLLSTAFEANALARSVASSDRRSASHEQGVE